MEDVSTLVGRMYEAFPYPPPAYDLERSVAEGGFQIGDPTYWTPMLWPEGRKRERLKILVAGCGTTQAAWLAFTNRMSDVTGVDLSEESLAHERYLQDKHALANLRLYKGDLRDVDQIGDRFDLVICTGVLHHLDEPDAGMAALERVMAPDAALACMVYAIARRTGVYMMQDVFRRLGIKADADGVGFARRALASLPEWHFVQQYLQQASELKHDAAIADTFLNPKDRAYTVGQVLALVETNGLHFQGWFENSVYYPEGVAWLSPELAARVAQLPAREQWAAMEMISPALSTHYFFARKSAAPEISFERSERLVPHRRPGITSRGGGRYGRAGRAFTLPPEDAARFEAADGLRTIKELGDANGLFERLWKQGHVMVSLAANAGESGSRNAVKAG